MGPAMNEDDSHMRHALVLAGRGLGMVAPNPAVGCVLIRDNHIVGRGWTGRGGRPHAETVALAQAGEAARGATAYVTLEPCAHHGQTPPCANALIAAGVTRVVVAVGDPDPRVNGRGIEMLRAANLDVTTGVCERDAAALNQGFFLKVRENRPLVTLKIAQCRDGKTIAPPGGSKWITGEAARRYGHLLRAKNDAILVGVNTALADDPELTSRLPGLEDRSPLRVVLDSRLRLPPSSKLAQTARQVPTLLFTLAQNGAALRDAGVEILRLVMDDGDRPDLAAVLGVLAHRGITRLLVEGGATVHGAFLQSGFADRLEVFTASADLGPGGRGVIAGLAGAISRFEKTGMRRFGPDVLETYAAPA